LYGQTYSKKVVFAEIVFFFQEEGERFLPHNSVILQSIAKCDVKRRFHSFTLIILFFLSLTGCKDLPPEPQLLAEQQEIVVIDEISIPILPSSEEQFNYTRSWFAERQVKRAALKAYLQLYPKNKKHCGMAALDLAYLQLGDDYRFASDKAYFDALDSYSAILSEYADLPEIMAKALWYIGWISTDLLYDRQRGLAAYRRVVEDYPREKVSLLPPAPWVSIIYPPESSQRNLVQEPSEKNWAALALLEIIKHTEDPEAAWVTFMRLWGDYRNDVATGFALRHVLRRRYHVDETRKMAMEFMEQNLSNLHILGDMRREIIAIESQKGAPVNED
jgi:tetratricopeptide (TPR) repeat protein